MKALWLVPLGLVALVGIAAAASTASASEAKEQLPADIDAMVRSAEASKDPVQIEAVARAIKSKYPKTAAILENEAAEIRKAKGTAAGAAAGAGAQSAGQQAAGQTGIVATGQTGITTGAGTTTATGTASTTGAGVANATSATAPGISTEVLAKINDALMSNDPQKMRDVANDIAMQYPLQGAQLLNAANILAGVQTAAVAGGSSVATGAGAAGTAGAGAAAAAAGGGLSRALALQAAAATWTSKTEDAATIRDYQVAERLKKQDGKYGTQTALSLAETYNLVPPTPLHWGDATAKNSYQSMQNDKNAYKTRLLNLATKFPAQAAQWRSAAAAVK